MRLGWSLPVEHLSSTSLMQAVQCPEQFRRRFLLKERDVMFGERFLGIVDHRTQEQALRYRMEEGVPMETEDVMGRYVAEWTATIEGEGEPDWRDEDAGEMYQRGLDGVRLYHERVGQHLDPVGLEERFEVAVPNVPVPLIGYVDIREKNLIRERKTTGIKVTRPKPKWTLQGRIYQMATGLPVQWDVVTRQKEPKLYTADEWPELRMEASNANATVAVVSDIAQRLNDLYTRYGADQPWPTLGTFHDWLCSYCMFGPKYQSSCVAWAASDAS